MASTLLGFDDVTTNLDDNFKLVPWLNWDEWSFVKHSLFSSSPHSIAKALRRIAAWRSRGCLPIAVEVSASFVEIQQKDPYFSGSLSNGAVDSEEMLSMLYTMAIMRLVNGIIEKTRQRQKVSIAVAADLIDMPRMLIDIRHEGSHRELPSLHLLRRASVLALDWLHSYYWDRQENAIPYQSAKSVNVRKEIRSRLRELAFCLKLKHSSASSSSRVIGKRRYFYGSELGDDEGEWVLKELGASLAFALDYIPLLYSSLGGTAHGHNRLFSLVACKFKSPKNAGSKKKTTKILKKLARLYSFFSSDVVSLLLELLLKPSNSKDSMDSPENFKIKPSLEAAHDAFDEWKPVIAKFSKLEPDVLLSVLKAVLDMIETHKSSRDDFAEAFAALGNVALAVMDLWLIYAVCYTTIFSQVCSENFSISKYDSETEIIAVLSSLFTWLVLVLKSLNLSLDGSEESHPGSDCCIPRTTLIEVVRRCLHIADPENHELLGSTLLIAKMVGNGHLNQKIQKLSLLTSLYSKHYEDSPSDGMTEELSNQDKYIHQAAQKLEMLKLRKFGKSNVTKIQDPNAQDGNIWSVAKSWKPCPIGMLPRAVGASGYLPVLDLDMDHDTKTALPSNDDQENLETSQCHKRDACCDIELMNESSIKRMRTAEESDLPLSDDTNVVLKSDGVKGRLLIDGFYQKVGDEESQNILSRLRVLVPTNNS
ncbi:hypothetical protein KSS87_008541 [Heliosperma pusillum]|nr:hypothetical protein KSS87_008541 [Heliosperma pusillum]